MAVTEVNSLYATGGISTDTPAKQYTVVHQVKTDSRNDGPKTVLAASSLPQWGAVYSFGSETDVGATFRSQNCKLIQEDRAHNKLWEVTTVFDSTIKAINKNPNEINTPADLPAEWSGSFFQSQKIVEVDEVTGEAITASSGAPFDPPFQRDASYPTIIVSRVEFSLRFPLFVSFRDAVNNTPFWGFAKWQIKVHNISWKQVYFGTGDYFEITYEFHVNDNPSWLHEPLDASIYKLGPDGCLLEIVKDAKGAPAAAPFLLDGNGDIKTCTEPAVTRGPYAVYPERNYAALTLPASIGAPS